MEKKGTRQLLRYFTKDDQHSLGGSNTLFCFCVMVHLLALIMSAHYETIYTLMKLLSTCASSRSATS